VWLLVARAPPVMNEHILDNIDDAPKTNRRFPRLPTVRSRRLLPFASEMQRRAEW
jgi:hypothetical protein